MWPFSDSACLIWEDTLNISGCQYLQTDVRFSFIQVKADLREQLDLFNSLVDVLPLLQKASFSKANDYR